MNAEPDNHERRSRDTRPQPPWRGGHPATACKAAILLALALLAWLAFQLRKGPPEGRVVYRPAPIPAGAASVAPDDPTAPAAPPVFDAFEPVPTAGDGFRLERLVLRSSALDGRPVPLVFEFARTDRGDGSRALRLDAGHDVWDPAAGERWGGAVYSASAERDAPSPRFPAFVAHRGRGTPRELSAAVPPSDGDALPVFCLLHDGTAPGAAALEAEFERDPAAAVAEAGEGRRGFVLWIRADADGPSATPEAVAEAGRALRDALAARRAAAAARAPEPWRFWPHDFRPGEGVALSFTNEAVEAVSAGRRIRARLVYECEAPGSAPGVFATGIVARVRAEACLETLRGGEWRRDPRFDLRLGRDGFLGTDAEGLPFCEGDLCDERFATQTASAWTPSGRTLLSLSLHTQGAPAPLHAILPPDRAATMLSSIWATVDYDGRALPFARYRDPPPAPSFPEPSTASSFPFPGPPPKPSPLEPLGPLCSLGLSVPTVNIAAVPPSAEPGVSH